MISKKRSSPKFKRFFCQNQKFCVFFRPKTGALQIKKGFRRNSNAFSARNQKFMVFFWPKTGDLQKKKVFAGNRSGFLLEIRSKPETRRSETKSVFSSASLFPRNVVLYSIELCTCFSSHHPVLKSRRGNAQISMRGRSISMGGRLISMRGRVPLVHHAI